MVDVIGTVSSVVSLVQITAETINHLRLAHQHKKDVETRFDQIRNVCCAFQANFERVNTNVNSEANALSDATVKQLLIHVDLVKSDMQNANAGLEGIRKSTPSSSSQSGIMRKFRRLKNTFKAAFNIDSITECLNDVERHVRRASDGTMQVMTLLGLDEI